ncbi:MAG TPA: UDP-2,4-diacetamido-2,4,6-trideoxy-beta-L-altropyranose hydrolase [Lentisphaeria bacterium]|nr:MAG: UDP-2,4-diacetamido-2,4,6-trideoxy-beta-L-altropyranose hydrolase [Lentisphaerae bacterium GWF2_38_69]HBM16709.1 UDP-2,4-diacetamido-2,4,6-trideoxy-beta-L-altropyranose hydrolase [Lentisphaeria bacterium]
MAIFVITEGNSKTGYGHIGRCSALYQAFQERGFTPQFIVNGDDSAKDILKGYEAFFFDWTKETNKLYEQINNSDIVIIDSYLADIEIYLKISELTKKAVYIDDYMRLEYPKGFVVNGTIYAEELPYPKKEGVEYLLGSKYIILRKEFWEVPKKEIRGEISKVLVTFGGSDIRNLTPKVLEIFTTTYPSWEKHVVIGNAFTSTEEIKQVADKNTIFNSAPNAEGMKNLMLDCDIAISAAGQTTNELARCGIPSIIIQVAENQKENIKGWRKAGFISKSTEWQKLDIQSQLASLSDINHRSKISKNGTKMVDGKGAGLIINKLIINYNSLSLRLATESDMLNLFELANDPAVRSNSFNSNEIELNEHKKWFNRILESSESLLFIVEDNGIFAGQVRFDNRNNEIIISIGIHHSFRAKKYGAEILKKALVNLKKHWGSVNYVNAYIRPENIPSQKIFERAGFNCTDKNSIPLKFVYTYK